MKYKHLFFDLDHTLWDFDKNAKETLLELYDTYELHNKGINSAEHFINVYTENNHRLWRDYHNGVITKEQLRAERFRKTFLDMGLSELHLPDQFEEDYVSICPTKTNLFPDALTTLHELNQKYELHIITNGFKDSSDLKINRTGLSPYFKNVFISEEIGIYKPDINLFYHAMNHVNTRAEEVVMIGDSIEADILGAKNAGIDQIYFNPAKLNREIEVTHEISELKQLLEIL